MSPRHSLLGTLAGAALALAALGLVACGTTDSGGNPGGNTDGGTKKDSGWTWDYGDASVYIPDGGELCPDCEQDAGACAANTTKAKELPLDIYIMLDQSSSMSDVAGTSTKWDTVASALQTFLSQPLVDVSVGIQFFGLPTGGAYSNDSCNAADYANPSVEIAPLPGVFNAIKSAVQAHSPSTMTPTAPALQGAINHAKSWAGFHPQHVTIVILATDGEPTECDPQDIPSIQQIAAAGVSSTPKILTFVIGVGSSLSNLNALASSGGTTQAFLVDTGANAQAQLTAALNQIRGAALGCSYQIPDTGDAGAPDFTKVNVQYTPGGSTTAQGIPMAPNQASCPPNADAWYYDNASAPTKIILCPYTCNRITPDTSGQVDILLGCKTQVIG